MLQNFSTSTDARRVAVLTKWAYISVSPIGGAVRIASSKFELDQLPINGALDGLPLNPPNSNTDVFQTWWIGELWIKASAPNVQCVVIIPGTHMQNL